MILAWKEKWAQRLWCENHSANILPNVHKHTHTHPFESNGTRRKMKPLHERNNAFVVNAELNARLLSKEERMTRDTNSGYICASWKHIERQMKISMRICQTFRFTIVISIESNCEFDWKNWFCICVSSWFNDFLFEAKNTVVWDVGDRTRGTPDLTGKT